MTTRIMKALLIVTVSIMYIPCLWAQGIIVHKSDGTMEKISYAAIDSIVTYANYADDGKQENGEHEAVDLGLSVKWATCNVGASSPEEYGGYYAWGETEEKSDYDEDTYKYCSDKDGDGYWGWDEYTNIGSNISGTSYDVAHVKWGGGWRMPTLDEIIELCNECSWEWTTVNGVNGQKVTGPNGNSIFLPAAGNRYGTELIGRGSNGDYWCGTLSEHVIKYTYTLGLGNGYRDRYVSNRYTGTPVRPVKK